MKRTFFAILMIVCCAIGFAQTRKVAIMETVDRQKQFPYGVKLMLLSYLAEAITNTTGYEAYVRTDDLNKIIDEQEFQRTGYVSDEEIKKIGQMTGVQYVLVAEISKIDEQNIFVTAKILNVETARMEMTANLMTKSDAQSLQQGAKDLASRLLKATDETTVSSVVAKPVVEAGYIERVSANEYTIGGQWVDRKTCYKFLQDNRQVCIPAYQQFQYGKKLSIAGWSVMGAGILGIFIGGMCFLVDDEAGIILCSMSPFVVAGAGIPLVSVGYSKMNNAYKKYNNHCAPKQTASAVTLNLQSGKTGIGLALNF